MRKTNTPEVAAPAHLTKDQVRRYVRPVPPTWFLKRKSYTLFMIRELSSAFLAGYAVFLLVMVASAKDPAAFSQFIDGLRNPLSMVLHVIVLAFALFHSITFFNLTPRVLVVQRGEDRVPAPLIAGAHYGMWVVASAILFFIATR